MRSRALQHSLPSAPQLQKAHAQRRRPRAAENNERQFLKHKKIPKPETESDVTCECLSDKSKLQGKENNQVQRDIQFSSVAQSCLPLCNPWTVAHQAFLSITNSWNLFKLMSIESVMPSNHLILCHPLLLLPSVFPSIRVFCNEATLCIRWPKNRSFSFSISPSKNIQD